jgi:antagonist of KipI
MVTAAAVSKIDVLSPGMQTTVQDLGRPGYGHLGVSACGAADPLALRLGNLLAGNFGGAAALEMTLLGGRFRFRGPASCVLAGADFGATLDGDPVELWTPKYIRAGQTLAFGGARIGARCYLCFQGGLQVQAILGSCSTHVPSGIGGIDGRPLIKGDLLAVRAPADDSSARSIHSALLERLRPSSGALRVTDSAQTADFAKESLNNLLSLPWSVQSDSNRMGVRLTGVPLQAPMSGNMTTEGAPLGSIQVTPSGEPVILFVDHQTTGGYPKIGCVISADHWRIGQLRPRQTVRFVHVSFEEARRLFLEQEALLRPEVLFG